MATFLWWLYIHSLICGLFHDAVSSSNCRLIDKTKNNGCGRKLFCCNLRQAYYCSPWWLLGNYVTIIPIYHILLYNILQMRFRCIFWLTYPFTFLLFLQCRINFTSHAKYGVGAVRRVSKIAKSDY